MTDKINDLTVINISPESKDLFEMKEVKDLFEHNYELAKYALFYAIKNELKIEASDNIGKGTAWNAQGTFDKDGSVKKILLTLGYEEPIYKKIQDLTSTGINYFHKEMKNNSNWLRKEMQKSVEAND